MDGKSLLLSSNRTRVLSILRYTYVFHFMKGKKSQVDEGIWPQCLACSWNIMNCNKTHSAYIIMYIFLFVSWGHCFKSYVTLPWIVFYNWMRVCVLCVLKALLWRRRFTHTRLAHPPPTRLFRRWSWCWKESQMFLFANTSMLSRDSTTTEKWKKNQSQNTDGYWWPLISRTGLQSAQN